MSQFNAIEELIEDIRMGKMVLLVDDEDRENEGDLVLAADHVTAEKINFMATEARGLICLAMAAEQIDKLRLPQMVRDEQNFSPHQTAFTVSIEASWGVSTGISAADRAHTVKVASNPQAKPSDVHMPGHIFPIRAQVGGVLRRAGHTEGSVDLAKLAGLNPSAVICEIMNADGTMARVPDLKLFAQRHQIKIGTIVDLIQYRLSRDVLVEECLNVELPSPYEGLRARVFKSKTDGSEHLVLQKGELRPEHPSLVRIQTENFSGDLLAMMAGELTSLQRSLRLIQQEGSGIILFLKSAEMKNSLTQEVKWICQGHSRSEMDSRAYGLGAQILRQVGLSQIRLITKRPEKRVGLKAFGIEIVETIGWKEEVDGKNKEGNKEQKGGSEQSDQKAQDWSRHLNLQ